jgi:hypothetical protein
MKKFVVLAVSVFIATFVFAQTKTEIRTTDISKTVTSYIAKNFAGYSIDKAFKIDSKGVMSTEVIVLKGNEKLALTFDKEFKLTKKEAIKPDVKVFNAKDDKKNLPPIKK